MRFLNFQLGKFFQLEKIPKNYMQRNLGREVYPKDFITRDLCPEGSLREQTHLSILCFNKVVVQKHVLTFSKHASRSGLFEILKMLLLSGWVGLVVWTVII